MTLGLLKHACVDSGQYGLNVSSADYVERGVRLLRTTDLGASVVADGGVFLNGPIDSRFLVRSGDLLLSRAGTIGQAYLACASDEGSSFAGYLVRFRPRDSVDPRFLYYTTQSQPFQDQVAAEAVVSTIANFNADRYANVQIPLAESVEQRRIADFLDDQVARIDNIIAGRERQVTLLVEQRDSLADDAFGAGGITVPLRRVVDRWVDYRGATPTKTDSGVPLVTARNIRDGQIIMEEAKEFISADDYEPWMRRGLPRQGDVLLTTEAPLGQVAQVVDTYIALAQRVILLRPSLSRIEARWLYWYLRSPSGNRELRLRATGSTAPGIKAERLREVPIPVPDIWEQRRRLAEVEDVDANWRTSRRLMAQSVRTLRELRRALITAAVSGEFDVSSADGSRVLV